MAKIPTQKAILQESFGEQKSWIGQLLTPLNMFMEQVTLALNRQITIKENMAGDVLHFVLDGNYPLQAKWNLKMKPTIAFIGQCREVSEVHTTITEAIYLDWEFTSNGMFQINNVADLNATSTNKFNLTVVALTG